MNFRGALEKNLFEILAKNSKNFAWNIGDFSVEQQPKFGKIRFSQYWVRNLIQFIE